MNKWQMEVEIDLTKLDKDLINTNLKDGKKFNRKNGGKTIIVKLTGLEDTTYGNNVRATQPGIKGSENERGDIVGNGRVYWTEDNTIAVAARDDKDAGSSNAPRVVAKDEDDLPF